MNKDPRRFYVYAYLRSKDSQHGKKLTPYYIGKGCRDRATAKCRTIPKPSDPSFIVYVQEGLAEDEAFSLEKYCIALYGRLDKGTGILRNLSDGGDGPAGAILTEERKRKISEWGRGRKHTQEALRKMSESQLGPKNHMWGKEVSAETRQKISDANKGLKRSDEARKNIANGKTKYRCELVDPQGNIHVVDNLYAFARKMGLHYTMLSWLVNGKKKKYKKWTCKSCTVVR
jgi:hypothetical protein